MQSTFTVLVTVEHSEEQGHSPSRIAEAIQLALEEGTSETAPFISAQVDAFKGRLVDHDLANGPSETARLLRILPLHA